MSLSPPALTIMPSENTFKHHVEAIRTALKAFEAIRQLDAPGPVKTAFHDLVAVTADLNNFLPFFASHPLFLEVPPLVSTILEDFLAKNPNFERPALYTKVAGLNARIKDSSAKKGMSLPLFLILMTSLSFFFY